MMLMGLGVKCGDTVTFTVEGPDETAAAEAVQKFMKKREAIQKLGLDRSVYNTLGLVQMQEKAKKDTARRRYYHGIQG